jgi:hypothetical protein
MLPRSISLMYEGLNSYTPSWYEGKRYSTVGDKVRVYAFVSISDGKNIINDSDLYFSWEMNDEILKGSGLGANYLDIDIPDTSDSINEVSVTVSPRLSGDSIKESIELKAVSPEVLLMYNESGITKYSKNLNGVTRASRGNSLDLVGIPLFYNILDSLSYSWTINNKKYNTTSNIRTLKLPNAEGRAVVKLKIENDKRLFQYGESSLQFSF